MRLAVLGLTSTGGAEHSAAGELRLPANQRAAKLSVFGLVSAALGSLHDMVFQGRHCGDGVYELEERVLLSFILLFFPKQSSS
jgi:hypothetical protein